MCTEKLRINKKREQKRTAIAYLGIEPQEVGLVIVDKHAILWVQHFS